VFTPDFGIVIRFQMNHVERVCSDHSRLATIRARPTGEVRVHFTVWIVVWLAAGRLELDEELFLSLHWSI
jgi:hypothetical protein